MGESRKASLEISKNEGRLVLTTKGWTDEFAKQPASTVGTGRIVFENRDHLLELRRDPSDGHLRYRPWKEGDSFYELRPVARTKVVLF